MDDACLILHLPPELLAQILSDCRPDGFESFMLSCKQVFEAGQHLIKPHQFCKNWRMFSLEYDASSYTRDHIMPIQPLEFFKRILDAPARYQPWLLLYITNFLLRRTEHYYYGDINIIRRVANEAPWLRDRLLETLNASPSFLKDSDIAEIFVFCLQDPLNNIPPLKLDEQKQLSDLIMGLSLLILPNLKTVSAAYFPSIFEQTGQSLMVRFIEHNAGQTFFQKLEKLHMHETMIELHSLPCFFALPRLKSLSIRVRRTSLKRVAISRNVQLEQFIMYSTVISPEDLSYVVAHLENLHSLVFEMKPHWTPSKYAADKKDDSLYLLDEEAVLSQPLYSSSDPNPDVDADPIDLAYDSEESDSEGAIEEIRVMDCLDIIRTKLDHSSKLKHLAISVPPTVRFPWVNPEQRIRDFKQFTHLTHLELNVNLLLPSTDQIMTSNERVRYLPRSLTEILPTSIQVLRLIIDNVDYKVMSRLLGDIRAERNKVPALRKVHLRVPGSFKRWQFSRHGTWEDFNSLYVWTGPLNSKGIEFVIEEVSGFKNIDYILQWDD